MDLEYKKKLNSRCVLLMCLVNQDLGGGTSIKTRLLADKPGCQAVRNNSFRKISYR